MMLWSKKGNENTDNTVKTTLNRARELNIKHIVVASGSGSSARQFTGKGFDVVCITRHTGYSQPGVNDFSPEVKTELEAQGVKVLTTTHLLAGPDRALRFKFQGVYPSEIISSALRMFGQGVKVCIEVSIMALDAGLIPYGEEIIAVGGSGKGVDAACVIEPAHSNYFFDTAVKEIICMPREK